MAYINLKTATSRDAQQLSSTLSQLNSAVATMASYYAKFSNMVDSPTNPTVFTGIESFLGLPAGQGQQVWAIFSAANALLTNPAVQSLQGQIG